MTAEGQVQIPTAGSGAGLVLGGDAQWYRSAANVMATPDDLYLAGAGLGIIHVDGVAAGWILVADGTRYVPANPAASLPIAPGNRGDIIRAEAGPVWAAYGAATAGAILIGDGTDIISDTTPQIAGDVRIGAADLGARTLTIAGAATGSAEGGQINLELAADYDGVFDVWAIDVFQDDLRLFTGPVVNTMTAEGQLQLPTVGVAAGVLIGGDAQWYRSAANVMATPDDLYLAGAGLGVVHVDGNTAGWVLRGDGTRYVPGAIQVGDVPGLDAQFVTLAASGDLANERVLTSGNGLAALADAGAGNAVTVSLGTPSTLTVSTANGLTATSHTHAITSSSNPGAAASILATDSNGYITLEDMYLDEYLWHTGDTDTSLRFQADRITLRAGGVDLLDLVEAGTDSVLFGAQADLNGLDLILDADGDSYLHASADDVLQFAVAGNAQYQFNATQMTISDAGGTPHLHFRTVGTLNTSADIYGESQLGLAADHSVWVFIDANDSGTNAQFIISNDQEIQTGATKLFVVGEDGRTGILAGTPSGQLHVYQNSASATIPVAYLRQADVDREFIRFHGTAAAADLSRSIVDYGDESTATQAVWIKVHVIDDGNQVTDQGYHVLGYILA
jgi:hypothetical protein